MSISKIRGYFYKVAKYLGDIQAIQKALKKGDLRPIITRILRRIYGKIASKGMGKIK
ncbi:hypothetical protein [Nitrosophilus kaiyonis]|uniref:hypothetical protein n=1 Tax=Nitrosophilus kaiyonis TaxID=2930200 RepID=UPI0024908ECB|nr:hypothetical protein [Nitrosophilus kaiyonis]